MLCEGPEQASPAAMPPLSPPALMPHLALYRGEKLQRSRRPSPTGLGGLALDEQMIAEDGGKALPHGGMDRGWSFTPDTI